MQFNFWYFFIWSIIFYLGLTFFSVPYVAMGYEMSDDFHERTNIMAIAQWIGQWAWVIAPWFWVIMYDTEWFPSADEAARGRVRQESTVQVELRRPVHDYHSRRFRVADEAA